MLTFKDNYTDDHKFNDDDKWLCANPNKEAKTDLKGPCQPFGHEVFTLLGTTCEKYLVIISNIR